MSEVQGSLKEALYEALNGCLATDRHNRQAAEQRLSALEVTEEFGIHLTEFVVDPNGVLAIRQLSSVLLKQYVEVHWTKLSEKFRPPELKPHVKEKIKTLLPIGLKESISKVRTAVAYAISMIAHWEWPENWPGLFNILVNCLSGENEYAVHGAMRVLTEFTRDLTDTHLPIVGPVILQEMYRILQNDTQYSIRIRGRAVEIFTTIANLVAEMDLYSRGFIDQHLQPIIPMFCEKFVYCLNMPDGPTSDSGLKAVIITAISCLASKLFKYMVNYVPQILPSIWNTLTQSAKTYQEEVVNGFDEVNDQIDSDGEVINFNNLIIATFDFVSTLIDHKKYYSILNNFLPDIMYHIIVFMQVTNDQIELWTNNPNQFIEEDDQCVTIYNVRISAQELLSILLTYNEELSVNALCNAVTKHIEAANNPQSPNCITRDPKNLWKIYESCIYALNTAKDTLIEQQHSGKLQFDMIRFLDSIVLSTLNNPGAHPLLLGRCLCIAGRYAKELPPEMSLKFLEAMVNGLMETQPICIRISSVKAIYWFCEAVSAADNASLINILRPQLPIIFQGLFAIANQPSKEILTIIMNAYSVLIPLDKNFTASAEDKICPFIIEAFLQFHSDPEILSLCEDIFKELSENTECVGPLQNRLVPTLLGMMNINQADKSKDDGSRPVALDILEVLVQYSPQPLSNLLIDSAFPAACHCILDSTDNGVLQSGGEVIRAYLSVAAPQIIELTDHEGRTGLQYVLQVIGRLLNPQSSEFTAAFVGRLVTTLIRKVGNSLGENLDQLLKAVLSKMQRTETSTVMQSLLMIYAHLINSQFDAVINFLSTVPGPTGESALAFVLTEWVNKQQMFFGNYERKVATVALCKILEYGVTHNDSRLNDITVDGDMINTDNESSGMRTRGKSQSAPMQWTKIPVLVKIFKLVVYELGNYLEANSATQEIEESDDDEENEDDPIDPGNDVVFPFAVSDNFDDENDEEAPDVMQDSIYHLNLGQYLKDFLQNFSSHHGFPAFAQHLNTSEKKILININIF